MEPYSGVQEHAVLHLIAIEGISPLDHFVTNHLEKSEELINCNSDLVGLLTACFSFDPTKRPPAQTLIGFPFFYYGRYESLEKRDHKEFKSNFLKVIPLTASTSKPISDSQHRNFICFLLDLLKRKLQYENLQKVAY